MIDQLQLYFVARPASLGLIGLSAVAAAALLLWVSYSKAFLAELLNSMRLQLLLIDLVLVFILSVLTLAIVNNSYLVWLAILMNIVCAVAVCTPILKFALFKKGPKKIQGKNLRVGSFNKQIGKQNAHLLVDRIKKLNLDVVGVSEVKQDDFNILRKADYPHMHSTNAKYGMGMAEFFIFSKYPLHNFEHFQLDRFGNCMRFEIKPASTAIAVYLIHTTAPIAPELFVKRNEGMIKLANIIASEKHQNIIAFGDMNVTPNSWVYRKFAKAISPRIYNVTQGWGLNFTWQYSGPLVTQLDHMWASSNIHTSKFSVDKRLESDHNLIWADLTYKD